MTTPVEQQTGATTGSNSFRPDIEGMRAVAVILILLFHAGIPAFSGGYIGVDVFFVISGFLITGLLVREIEGSGTVDRRRFYARRIRRLLPAAATVLGAVAALTIIALPMIRWAGIAADIRWSALYAVNWRFAGQAVDYLAAAEATSPLQHFWSLAVEEQFYLVWPLLLVGSSRVATSRRTGFRPTLLAALAAVALPSFIWSVYLTGAEPGRAYFVSTTRAWELAIGSALAILAPYLARVPRRLAVWLAGLGIAGIIWSAITYDSLTPFPGYTAALPVAASAMVIAAGTASANTFVARWLGTRPMRLIGSMSYSLYLWHWPITVVAVATWGPLSAWQGSAVVGASIVPAAAAYRYVERRWRYDDSFIDPPQRGLAIGVALTFAGLLAAVALSAAIPDSRADAGDTGSQVAAPTSPPTTTTVNTTTAAVTGTTAATAPATTAPPTEVEEPEVVIGPIQPTTQLQLTAGSIQPDPLDARADLPAVYGDGCHQNQTDPGITSCTYGDPAAPTRVAIVGDSHAAMWVPTLRELAAEEGWQLRTMTKSNCQLADVLLANGPQLRPYTNCVEWNTNVAIELTETRPDLVIVAGRFWPTLIEDDELLEPDGTAAALAAGLTSAWAALVDSDIAVVAVRDVPYPNFDVAECVSEQRSDLAECAMDRSEVMAGNTPHLVAAPLAGAGLVDLTDQICFAAVCPAVIDDVLVWRDTHHLTATYARLLAPPFAQQLLEQAPHIFTDEGSR